MPRPCRSSTVVIAASVNTFPAVMFQRLELLAKSHLLRL